MEESCGCGHHHDDHSPPVHSPVPVPEGETNFNLYLNSGTQLVLSVIESLREQAPWFVLGILLASVLVFIPSLSSIVVNALSAKRKFAIPLAALLGISIPLCSCGTLPIAALLARRGVERGAVVAFLIAAQSAGLDSALTTFALIGTQATLLRIGNALIAAILCGYVASLFSHTPTQAEQKKVSNKDQEGAEGFIATAKEIFASVAPWLFLGELLTQAVAPILNGYLQTQN